MSFVINLLSNIAKILPEVKKPDRQPTTKERLLWTGIVLILFFIMYHVTVFGVEKRETAFDFIQTITASNLGSILTIGIGPIVFASIFLQLFVGAGILKLNLRDKNDKQKFHEVQKVLTIVIAIVEATFFVLGAMVFISPSVYSILGQFTVPLVVLQIALGSVFLLYMDEVTNRYGIGSGISLFIAAGVSLAIFSGFINLLFGPNSVVSILSGGEAEAIPNALLTLLPFFFMILVFLVCIYAEGMKVEIPIAFGRIRGFAPRLPLRFFYVSVMPIIFASALLVNVQMFAYTLISQPVPAEGYQLTHHIGGLIYLITPIYAGNRGTLGQIEYLTKDVTPVFKIPEWVHALVYILFLMLASILFGIFWVETANMDAKSMANQLSDSGLQIPGFRNDPRMLETILSKYIFPLTVLGSAAVGVLAGLADLTGALGTGTGILLTVGILYKMYEQMEQMQMFELYPTLKKIVS